ncbi:8-oxoguanine deaminase [Singulisphaera sp. PoT]|uniref:8-oxoguanine deaminase n=1 Tax=Singulisphaera sp. PoT TaxID=3411797 RepID=UPI003BF4F055
MLVKNATVLVTMDGTRREIPGGGLFIRDGKIEKVGPTSELPTEADEVLDLAGHVVLPGLVNVHHHLYQTLFRVVPGAQDGNVFNWLQTLYTMWARMTPDALASATRTGLAELALTGCTTVFDHSYVFPNACRVDDQVEVARDMGVRFHVSRGSMSLGQSKGGLPPDSCVEDEEAILKDSRRVIEAYHDPEPGSMTRIVLAPCSPFSVTPDLMRESAKMARAYKVHLHTHLAESLDEERYTTKNFGVRPVGLMEQLDWVGNDVWFAHAVHIDDAEIGTFARTGCGVAHCPSSNMRLASGIAPVWKYRKAGVRTGLGVDGSASNDSSHMLAEARMAMLLARTQLSFNPGGPPAEKSFWMTARDVLEMGTRGGAEVLGRDDIGSLEPGKCADFFAVRLDGIEYAGGLHDPVAATVFCAPARANYTVIDGRVIVDQGRITTLDLPRVIEDQNRIARSLVDG